MLIHQNRYVSCPSICHGDRETSPSPSLRLGLLLSPLLFFLGQLKPQYCLLGPRQLYLHTSILVVRIVRRVPRTVHNSGMPALAAIEAIPTDPKDKPKEEVVLVKATVFSNPITEMEDALEQELQVKIDEREVS